MNKDSFHDALMIYMKSGIKVMKVVAIVGLSVFALLYLIGSFL